MNVRFFSLSERLGFMDTVGNGQLDVRDVEAIFPTEMYSPGDVDYYLRNVTHYLLDDDREIQPGEAIDGPGESSLSWTAEVLDEGVVKPPSSVAALSEDERQDRPRGADGRGTFAGVSGRQWGERSHDATSYNILANRLKEWYDRSGVTGVSILNVETQKWRLLGRF
jgi:hypothetical protein